MQIIVCKRWHLLHSSGNNAAQPKLTTGAANPGHLVQKAVRIMKLTAFLILATCLHVNATDGFGQKVTLSEREVHIEKIFTEIKKQTGFNFLYTSNILANTHRVTVKVTDATINEVLDIALVGQGLVYRVKSEDNLVIVKVKPLVKSITEMSAATGEPIDVSGKVTDGDGKALSGANVKVRGTTVGVTTDNNGHFVLKNVAPNAVLEITFVGHEMKTIAVRASGFLSISLEHKVSMLDETVVIPYGQTTRRYSTGNVGTVKAKDIELQPVNNPLLALQGRVPGVEVIQLSGMNGGPVMIKIQGRSSIRSGIDPLIVIDGVPYPSQLANTGYESIVTAASPNSTAQTQVGSPLNYINPADIESIDVLKDADATAIYGSRAANGAILITTKKGKVGPTKLSVNMQQGWAKVTRKVKMLNTRQYLDMRYEALRNDGIVLSANNDNDLKLWDTTRYTDWQKTLIGGTAKYTNVNVGISGGTSAVQYMVGGTYNRRTTVFPGDFDDKSGSIHFNINGASPNQKLKMQLSASYMFDLNRLPGTDLTSRAISLEPNAPALYKEDGTLNWEPNAAGSSTWFNPLVYTISNDFTNTTKNIVSNAILSYKILPGFDIRGSFGYTNLQSNIFVPTRLETFAPESRLSASRTALYGYRNMESWIIEPQALYKRTFNRLNVEGLIGGTIQQNTSYVLSLFGSGYNNDLVMKSITSALSIMPQTSSSTMYKYNALFGRLNFDWNKKYIMSFNARRDGSSRFGDKNKLHNFGSIGLAWIFTNEKWMQKGVSIMSFGKLRGSFGITGNDQIGDYSYLSAYGASNGAIPYQNASGLAVGSIPNPYLQWEETKKWQGGIDLGFLNDRIIVNATYCLNRSSNQLLPYPLPVITGFNNIFENFPATVQNTSWEFTLVSTNIKSREITWTSNFNLTIARNKLVSFPNIENTTYGSATSTVRVGYPLNFFRAYQYAGVDEATGSYAVYNSDGNPIITGMLPADRRIFISTLPKFYGGFENSVSYRGFQLNFLFQFVVQKGAKQMYFSTETNSPGRAGNQPVSVLNRWQKPGDVNTIGRFTTKTSFSVLPLNSDNGYSYDASYLRLKNVSLSWQLPARLLQKVHLQSTQFYFRGQNLATISKFTGLDPETQSVSNLPPLQMWTVGMQVVL